jgi:ATP synthase protein I
MCCNQDGMNEETKKPQRKPGPLGDLAKGESMVQLALSIPMGCFVGLLVGTLLDRHFHQHWIAVLGMLLGAAGGFVQVFTYAARSMKRDD